MPISIPTSVAGISVPGAINGPLSILYGNKYLKDSYAFPRDLGSNPARNHVIWFDIMKPTPDTQGLSASIATAGVKLAAAQGGLRFAKIENDVQAEQEYKAIIDAQQDTISKSVQQTDNLSKSLVDDLVGLNLKKTSKTSIALYIPDTVNVTYSAAYDDIALTRELGTPYLLAQGAVSAFDAVRNKGSAAEQVMNQSGNDAAIRKALGEGVNKLTGSNVFGDLALKAGGYAMNPQLQVLFQGIGFREFQFDFTLTPSTKEESDTIKKIIKAFKSAAAPEFMTNGVFTQSVFLKLPDTFNVKFLYNGVENPNVHKIGESVLTNINVDYAPNGWSTFNDGSAIQTKLTLQFKETVIIDKKMIEGGY